MIQPNLHVLHKEQQVLDLTERLKGEDLVAYDCETTGLHVGCQVIGISVCFNEQKAYYVIIYGWDKAEGKLKDYGTLQACTELIKGLAKNSRLICHNGVFDCAKAEEFFKIRLIDSLHTDTMILAHLLNENRRVGLKELASEYFGENSTAEQDEMKASVVANGGIYNGSDKQMYKADPFLLGKYGAKDAWLTYMLFIELLPELYDQNLDKFFYEDESMPLLRGPTYELNTVGLKVDQQYLTTLKTTLQAECAEAKSFIYKEIAPYIKDKYPGTNKKNTFNIGASQQLSWLLFGKLNLEFSTLTDGGKNACKTLGLRLPYTRAAKNDFIQLCLNRKGDIQSPEGTKNGKKVAAKKLKEPWAYIACDKKTLLKLAHKYKWIERLLEHQRKTKLLSTYIEGIEERIQYGVVYAGYLQHGTLTGRYASRNPNLMNLPRDDQRIKHCFVARPGKVFVSADFSQLEPRIFSYYSKDPRLMAAFDGTSDFYSVVGAEVYDKTDCTLQKDGSSEAFGIKYKKYRDLSKTIALAAAYGATPFQLAPTTGKSVEETEQDMNKYFERFPGVKKMMLEAHDLVKEKGYVTNIFGRLRRIPEAKSIAKAYGNVDHWGLPYDARKLLNMACNFRIQSTGASIINRAVIQFKKDCQTAGIDCAVVSQIHDELVVECKEQDAENTALLLQNAMENTTILEGMPLEAVPRVTRTLAK